MKTCALISCLTSAFFLCGFASAQTQSQTGPTRNQPSAAANSNQSPNQNGTQNPTPGAGAGQQPNARGMRSVQARNSEAAVDLLSATRQARNALGDYDKEDAMTHIDHALAKANQITQQGTGHFVQIYSELSRYSVIEPVLRSRAQQGEQPNAQQQGQLNANPEQTEETPVGVQQVEGAFTSVDLDVIAARDHLRAAKTALENGDYQKADAALKAVEDGVDVASVSADLPLVRARENLMLAHESASQGDSREVRAALKEASAALTNYINMGGSHSSQARTLCSQIQNFRASGSQGQGVQNSAAQIATWWSQVASWNQMSRSNS